MRGAQDSDGLLVFGTAAEKRGRPNVQRLDRASHITAESGLRRLNSL